MYSKKKCVALFGVLTAYITSSNLQDRREMTNSTRSKKTTRKLVNHEPCRRDFYNATLGQDLKGGQNEKVFCNDK